MLFLIRHGETFWNADGRLQGQCDTKLNGRGREQARESGRLLAKLVPDASETSFIASPLIRARESLEILMGELVAKAALEAVGPYAVDDRLKELGFGRWEGLTWKEVRRDAPKEYAARDADVWNIAPPGGESYASLANRAGPLLAELRSGTVIVSHGGITRIALHLFAGVGPEAAAKAMIRQGDVLVLDEARTRWASGAVLETGLSHSLQER
ncbi:MAG: histidine phosphatase family protein [Hyphomicrobiales bacterium]|nr:histidine phosphatase family protein [Hyphomicrobiales bacterium]